MVIDISRLQEQGGRLELSLSLSPAELSIGEVVSVDEPVDVNVRLVLSGDRIRASGQISAGIKVPCDRCCRPIAQQVRKHFEVEYWPDPEVEVEGEEIELSYADLDVGFYRGEQLDVGALISEQILLEVPMKLVCRSDCRGLCDQCGADLNEGDCGCQRQTMDPRLEVLRELRKKMT